LQFEDYPEDLEQKFNLIVKSPYINNSLKDYMKEKYKKVKFWAKCYMKKKFCCGTCTSSRIESKHKILKKYLNSSKRLTELFKTLKQLKNTETSKFKEEVERFTKEDNRVIGKYELIKKLKEKYSNYCLKIIQKNLLESLNYEANQQKENLWYLNFVI